jgi:hypothetical protein
MEIHKLRIKKEEGMKRPSCSCGAEAATPKVNLSRAQAEGWYDAHVRAMVIADALERAMRR